MTREEIRAEIRNERDAMSCIQAAELSGRVCERIMGMPEFKKAKRILCYMSAGREVQTNILIKASISAGYEVCVPVVRGKGLMDAVRVTEDSVMRANRFGIAEPEAGEVVLPRSIDLVLAPGIAFDESGNRLGTGHGYFDRYLADCRCPVVALAYEMKIVPRIEPGAFDVPMDFIATEKRLITCCRTGI